MESLNATAKADAILTKMLENQPNLFGNVTIATVESAKRVAQSIAAFRAELVAELSKQES